MHAIPIAKPMGQRLGARTMRLLVVDLGHARSCGIQRGPSGPVNDVTAGKRRPGPSARRRRIVCRVPRLLLPAAIDRR